MFEVGKYYRVTIMNGALLEITDELQVIEVWRRLVRFRTSRGGEIIINVASEMFVRADTTGH